MEVIAIQKSVLEGMKNELKALLELTENATKKYTPIFKKECAPMASKSEMKNFEKTVEVQHHQRKPGEGQKGAKWHIAACAQA